MNNDYNIIRILRERLLKSSYPVYHAPLIWDINTQRSHRKTGYVAWPEATTSGTEAKEKKEKQKRPADGPYFAYPQK
jgi:hypothetical protein